jgi:hypothetical protein
MSYGERALGLQHDIALFLTILIITSMVVGSITWVYLNPRPEEQFFALGILGENMMAERYYPRNESTILMGDLVKWYVTVYNHMGSVQYVSIRAKLLNQTTPPPDDMNHTASAVPPFQEIRQVLADNETWTFPLDWSVEGMAWSNDSLRITALKLNNVTLTQDLNTTARQGYNFRIVLELWSYTNRTAGFQFGWRSGSELRSAWVQIWFNLTASTVAQNRTAEDIGGGPEGMVVTNPHDEFLNPFIGLGGVDAQYPEESIQGLERARIGGNMMKDRLQDRKGNIIVPGK